MPPRRQPAERRHALAGTPAGRYNPGMPRPTRLGLAIAALVIAGCGAYAAFWFVAASQIEDGVGRWAQSLRPRNLDLSWRAIRVGGFPLAFRVELNEARLRGRAATATTELQVPQLSGSAWPWNLRLWRVTAPDGLSATANLAAGPVATLTARAASGSVMVSDDGGATAWLGLSEPPPMPARTLLRGTPIYG